MAWWLPSSRKIVSVLKKSTVCWRVWRFNVNSRPRPKPLGVVAVGGSRNGGQELIISQIQTAMLCFGMIPVGGHAPAFQGGTLVNTNDSINDDEPGLKSAQLLGKRIGEVALHAARKDA